MVIVAVHLDAVTRKARSLRPRTMSGSAPRSRLSESALESP